MSRRMRVAPRLLGVGYHLVLFATWQLIGLGLGFILVSLSGALTMIAVLFLVATPRDRQHLLSSLRPWRKLPVLFAVQAARGASAGVLAAGAVYVVLRSDWALPLQGLTLLTIAFSLWAIREFKLPEHA